VNAALANQILPLIQFLFVLDVSFIFLFLILAEAAKENFNRFKIK
jgi:hypothetical protein